MCKYGTCAVAAVLLALACPKAECQATVNGVRIYTEPQGRYFQIDGQTFSGAVDLLWPANSKHVVTSYDQNDGLGRNYTFRGAATNLGDVLSQPVSADAGVKWIRLNFDTRYALTIALTACTDPTEPCASAGRIAVNGTVYDRRTTLWLAAGTPIQAQAFPNPGYIFTGWVWIQGLAPNPTAFITSFTLNAPQTLAAQFRQATPVNVAVNIQTDPPSLQILADRTPYTAPMTLEWGLDTVHALGVQAVQWLFDRNRPYVFESWSDGGAANHDFVVPGQQSAPISITARFVPGATVALLTSPPNLALNVDGRRNWSSYTFIWAGGTVHTISAPETQRDAQGRKYRFVAWSNGKPGAFTYTVAQPPEDDRITAVYEPVGEITITSSPEGLPFEVDGASCSTPCALERAVDVPIRVTVPAFESTGENSRFAFRGWGDSSEMSRNIVARAAPSTYIASYALQSRLAVASNPVEGASFETLPASPDRFYDLGTCVSISPNLAPGFRMKSWSGDLSGRASVAEVTMDGPKTVVLQLERVPELSPSGVRNAAMPAVPSAVAPGSLIAILGANLAPDLVAGPSAVLAQTLADVTVRVDSQFLPLVFVSPQQINAQLISGLDPGNHTLTVRWEGRPETSIDFVVARNAPGLLTSEGEGGVIGVFARENGELVTAQAPARPGETIKALGTGLGPYQRTPPDGFLFEESAGFLLADPVSVVVEANAPADALYAGRSGVGVGIDAVNFVVPAIETDSTVVRVCIRVNGQESNTVLLPVTAQ